MSLYKRALRTFDTASLSGTKQNVGASIDFAVSKVSITNTSTVGVLISDGTTEDNIEIPGGGTLSIGEGIANNNSTSTKLVFPAGVQLQVEQVTAAAAGKLIINALG